MMSSAWGLVIASGKPESFGTGVDPSFLTLGSKPVLMHSLAAFEKCADIESLVVLASKDRVDSIRAMIQIFGCAKVKRIIPMGAQRLPTMLGLLQELKGEKISVLTIHEGTRPMVKPEEISETIKVARKVGAAALCEKIQDPILFTDKGNKVVDAPRDGTAWLRCYPQSFKMDLLAKCLDAASKKKAVLRDECDALAFAKAEMHVVPSQQPMLRISGPRDLVLADHWMRH